MWIMQKRYQHYTANGIEWSKWFEIPTARTLPEWQLKGKLRNEYRSVETDSGMIVPLHANKDK